VDVQYLPPLIFQISYKSKGSTSRPMANTIQWIS
jgi:hypothetical protein